MLWERLQQPVHFRGHVHGRAGRDHHGDRFGLQPAGGEHDRLQGGHVEPLPIVDGDEQGLRVGGRGQQGQGGRGHRQPVPAAAGHGSQLQGPGQGLRLNRRKLAQQPGQRFQQPGQAGEGDLDLRLVALDLQDAEAVHGAGGEREQAGLPDAGLAAQQDHAGRFFPGARDKAPEQLALRGAADQHALILGAGGR